jgi:hypothetical protein
MSENNFRPSRRLRIGFALMGVASICGLGYMIFTAIDRISSGRGLEVQRTFWLIESNWIEFIVFLATLIVALIVAVGFHIREYLLMRSMEHKYDSQDKSA